MTENDTVQTESGVAVLAEGYTEDNAPFVVSGVALGEGDITKGQSGVPTMWSAEVLRQAASLFEGVPIVKNDHSLDEQPRADNVIGEVTEARYREGVGVAFRGEIIDADIARKVDEGLLDVSPVMARELGDGEMEFNGQQVVPAESIRDVREIGIVMKGAAPSNEIRTGAPAALSREALSQVFTDDDETDGALVNVNGTEIDLSPPESMTNAAEAAAEAGREGLIPSDCGTGVGDRRRTQIQNADFGADDIREIDSYLVSHEEDVSADGVPSQWSGDEWGDCGNAQYAKWGGTGGGEPMNWAMRCVNETDQARGDEPTYPELMSDDATDDEAAQASEEANEALETVAGVTFDDTESGELDESEIPNDDYEGHYLYPGETKTESSYAVVDADGNLRRGNVESAHQLGCRGRCDDAEEHDRRVTELARQFDDVPDFAEQENEANNESMEDEPELSDEERELLSEARKHDEAVVLGADEHEALMEEVETAKDAYAEVLAEEWGTDTEKIATNFGIEALREEVEGMTKDDGVDEALAQNPETGDADVDDEDEGGVDEEALERIGEIDKKLSTVGTALPDDRVEELQNEAMELADADSYDEALDYTEV